MELDDLRAAFGRESLWQVKGTTNSGTAFCAGIITAIDEEDGQEKVVHAAPLLRFCMGQTRYKLREWFKKKGWKAYKVQIRVEEKKK